MTAILLLLALLQGFSSPAITAAEQGRITALEKVTDRKVAMPIGAAIPAIRSGLADASAVVRQSAMSTIHVRALSSLWAGTRGPESGPLPAGMTPPPPQPIIPAEWRGDRARLTTDFFERCLVMARVDASDEVRLAALSAAYVLDIDPARAMTVSSRMQTTLLSLLREDHSPRIRKAVVQSLRLAGIETPEAVAALAKALVDPARDVQWNARMAIHNSTAGPVVKVRFADARPILVAALASTNGDVKAGALEAFGEFEKESAPELPAIDRVANSDPDSSVRALAARVAARIRKQ